MISIDDRMICVDYERSRIMPGFIPRRLGGGLCGKKESGQLRFGGRDRPFNAPYNPALRKPNRNNLNNRNTNYNRDRN